MSSETIKQKNVCEIIWLCIGIFTNNWFIFLFLLLVNLIANINSSKRLYVVLRCLVTKFSIFFNIEKKIEKNILNESFFC